MNKRLITLILLASTTVASLAQNINLNLDFTSSQAVLDVLTKGKSDRLSDEQILELQGTLGMIKHDSRFNPKISKDQYLLELKNADSELDAFRFKGIRKNVESIKHMISQINDDPDYIKRLIEERVSDYLPDNQLPPTTVYFVLGGNSDGYTDGTSFYIELQFFDDLEGLALLISHEIYHIYQQKLNPYFTKLQNIPSSEQVTYALPINIYMEGIASYIANPLLIENPGSYVQFNQKKYKRNFERMKDSFVLFEALLSYSKEVNLSQFGSVYNLGFSGNWDSPLYFVGFKICEQIELANGRYSIKEYMDKAPTQLLVDYITLYKNDENVPYKFSSETEQIINELHNELIANN